MRALDYVFAMQVGGKGVGGEARWIEVLHAVSPACLAQWPIVRCVLALARVLTAHFALRPITTCVLFHLCVLTARFALRPITASVLFHVCVLTACFASRPITTARTAADHCVPHRPVRKPVLLVLEDRTSHADC